MGRIIWVLPLCLALHGQANFLATIPVESSGETRVLPQSPSINIGLDLGRQQLLGSLALTSQAGFPGTLPWGTLYQIGESERIPLENILAQQPLLFLQMCLERQEQEVQGYSCIFRKQERVKDKLQPPEKIKVHFREKPFSVFFDWQEGARLAKRVLYVEGENRGQMLVRPNILLLGSLIVPKDPEGAEATQTSRYSIKQFGLKLATQRSVQSMLEAQQHGTLHIRYDGEVLVPELNNRACYKFIRTPYNPPEEEGVNELVLYIDKVHWLQVGSILKDVHGEIIAEYFFRDLEINPTFSKDQFTSKGL
jgi:hypothetical protein